MRSPFLLRSFALTLVAAGVVLATRSHDASAAWPPPQGADMRDKSNWPNDFNGRWNYISFFPERAPNAPPLDSFDQKLGAAGMSIDRAWTLTIGRPEVKIGVIDSGIEWDHPDLAVKAFINAAELTGDKLPKTAEGAACGGAGALAGYDCDGDGIFT